MDISMDEAIAKFPDFLVEAKTISQSISPNITDIDKIFVLGMGGSALGGDLLSVILEKISPVPVHVIRNDAIPAFLDRRSLIFAVSYSGNTQETLTAVQQAETRAPGKIIAISTGGTLKEWAQKKSLPFVEIPGGLMPRAALPYTFVPLLFLSQKVLKFDDPSSAFEEMVHVLRSMHDLTVAHQIAQSLKNKVTVIYGAHPSLAPAAKRWKCQINENAKQPAYGLSFPEVAHNEIVGYTYKLEVHQSISTIILVDENEDAPTKARVEFAKKAMQNSGCIVHEVVSQGKSFLAKLLSLCYAGDHVSLALAKALQIDPVPIEIIDRLKKEMKHVAVPSA